MIFKTPYLLRKVKFYTFTYLVFLTTLLTPPYVTFRKFTSQKTSFLCTRYSIKTEVEFPFVLVSENR